MKKLIQKICVIFWLTLIYRVVRQNISRWQKKIIWANSRQLKYPNSLMVHIMLIKHGVLQGHYSNE